MVSFKTAAGAIIVVQRHANKDIDNGRLQVDTIAIIEGKQDMHKQGQRVILLYKAHMYNEVSL